MVRATLSSDLCFCFHANQRESGHPLPSTSLLNSKQQSFYKMQMLNFSSETGFMVYQWQTRQPETGDFETILK